jgi:type 1 glutamine amidotransferase
VWLLAFWTAVSACGVAAAEVTPASVVFLAGAASDHGPGEHEYVEGCRLLARALERGEARVKATVCQGWPATEAILDSARAIVVYGDGEEEHLLLPHLDRFGELMQRGIGFVCLHYALDVPADTAGPRFRAWLGGCYEAWWSVNPVWEADFRQVSEHPVTRGVQPFRLREEWYYNLRFREGMAGVTPVLTAVPPNITRRGPNSAHHGNPYVRARMDEPEHVAWVYERAGGGRGFGFSGGHWHQTWADTNVRRLVLNAMVWAAGLEVPATGVDPAANADPPKP